MENNVYGIQEILLKFCGEQVVATFDEYRRLEVSPVSWWFFRGLYCIYIYWQLPSGELT